MTEEAKASETPAGANIIEEFPNVTEDIAAAIVRIADATDSLQRGSLTERALYVLIADASELPQNTVWRVLGGIKKLRQLYLKSS